MRNQTITRMIIVTAVVGGLLAGCGTTSTGPATISPPATSATGAGQPQHNQADIAFVQAMIPHHVQAIVMAQLASSWAASPKVKALTSRIEAEQNPEIQQMSALPATRRCT